MSRAPACSWPMAIWRAMSSLPFLFQALIERARQERKWGPQRHPSFPKRGPQPSEVEEAVKEICEEDFRNGDPSWMAILDEEVAEAMCQPDPTKLRAELIQVAAVSAAWWERS